MRARKLKEVLLASLWAKRETAPSGVHEEITAAVNAALQTMWQSPKGEFFRRQNFEVSLVPGNSAYTLTREIQAVRHSVRINNKPLMEVKDHANFIDAENRFGMCDTSKPSLFHLERVNDGPTTDDAARIHLHLFPTPVAVDTLFYVGEVEAPRFDACDLEEEDREIPVPHGYVESTLLPIARWNVKDASWFQRPERIDHMNQDYLRALAQMGLTDPSPAKNDRPKPKEMAA